jgi:ABC-2 type transport system permease protein
VNWHAVFAIVRKDIATVTRNRGVRIPLLVTPTVILVLLPVILVGGAEMLVSGTTIPLEEAARTPFTPGYEGGSPAPAAEGLDPVGRWAVFVLEVFLAPLFLLVPLIVATVIAADSFAGERERGTLEALLHTPTSDQELLTGKFLAAWLPAMTVTLGGFAVYSVLANLLAWPSLGRVFFPSPTWLLLAFLVSPGLAALGLSIMVIASSRVQSLQGAHQIGSLVVLPIVLLLIVQVSGILLLDVASVVVLGVVIWVSAVGIVVLGARTLKRERLAMRL